jgi:uncharacterized membrane protein YphA (DoxX/SURF4 family)
LTALLQGQALEHGSTRSGRWLRRYRLRIAVWIAVVEGLLIVLDVIPWWPALLVAAVLLAFWWFVGRNTRSDSVREGSRIAAASQAMMALIPIPGDFRPRLARSRRPGAPVLRWSLVFAGERPLSGA